MGLSIGVGYTVTSGKPMTGLAAVICSMACLSALRTPAPPPDLAPRQRFPAALLTPEVGLSSRCALRSRDGVSSAQTAGARPSGPADRTRRR